MNIYIRKLRTVYFQFLYVISLCVSNFISMPIIFVVAFPVCVCNQPLGKESVGISTVRTDISHTHCLHLSPVCVNL